MVEPTDTETRGKTLLKSDITDIDELPTSTSVVLLNSDRKITLHYVWSYSSQNKYNVDTLRHSSLHRKSKRRNETHQIWNFKFYFPYNYKLTK